MVGDDEVRVLITGAAGMIGRKLADRLATHASLAGRNIASLHLIDIVDPDVPAASRVEVSTDAVDLTDPGAAPRVLASRPDVVFHLAAVVSGEAETDFDKGYSVNLDGTRWLLEAARTLGASEVWCPRFVFTSSIGVFGGPYPPKIQDDFHLTPHTSYGTQKVIGEVLVGDYTRRGFIDGVAIRLPTICVRPGTPNKAASGFFSSILREPLVGRPAVLPVGDDVRNWFASPRAAVDYLVQAATIAGDGLGGRIALTMPGVSASVADEVEALRAVAGDAAVDLIRREPDPLTIELTAGWPNAFAADRALALGFRPDASIDAIVRAHIDDELGGELAAWPDVPINQEQR